MDEMQREHAAYLRCQQLAGKVLVHDGTAGSVEVLHDQNCCAPSQALLFAFVTKNGRRVMSAKECLSFLEECIVKDEC